MRPEEELLAKLERWLAACSEPPTVFDVIETEDRELLAAFILKGFRAAARQAVVDRLAGEAATTFATEPARATAVLRVFDGLARAWSLQEREKLALLGLQQSKELTALGATPLDALPTEIIERVAILVDIFKAINTLLPEPQRADRWMRAPNAAPMFAGDPALKIMIAGGLPALRQVRAYLWGELYSK